MPYRVNYRLKRPSRLPQLIFFGALAAVNLAVAIAVLHRG
jgi:hypothetical protein